MTPLHWAPSLPTDFIDAGSLKAHAALDWVDIRLTLSRPTQGRHLYGQFHRHDISHFEPVNDATGQPYPKGTRATTTTFIARVQTPDTTARVRELLAPIAAVYGFAADPEIVGIELSIWLRLRQPPDAEPDHRNELGRVAELVYRGLAHPVSKDHRLIREGSPRSTQNRDTNRKALTAGDHSIYIGHAGESLGQRVYVATTDRNGPAGRRALHRPAWATKLETILQGEAVPFRSFADWETFDFGRLMPHFAVRRPAAGVPVPPCAQFARANSGRLRHQHHPATEADTPMNERIRVALRSLSRRSLTQSPRPPVCRNSDRDTKKSTLPVNTSEVPPRHRENGPVSGPAEARSADSRLNTVERENTALQPFSTQDVEAKTATWNP